MKKYYLYLFLPVLIVNLMSCKDDNPVDYSKSKITECVDGMAGGKYPCKNVDLLAHITPTELLGEKLNDIWGWTDPQTGKEYALVGMIGQVAFVDISNPVEPVVVGILPESNTGDGTFSSNSGHPRVQQHGKSAWRDLKVYKNFVFVVSDAQPHGMQVFDLTRLRNVENPPVTFNEDVLYDKIENAHNIAIDKATGFAYLVGSNTYGGGLHIVDISNPLQPEFAGFHSDSTVGIANTGYVHDTQCVIYKGPDSDYQGDEICFNSSETHFVIANVADKNSTYTISKGTYEGVAYTHQGWLTEDHKYFLLGDELDEYYRSGITRTIIWDVTNLDNPKVIGIYKSPNHSIGHNMYTKDGLLYQSNYSAGLRILSLDNVATGQLSEVAYFDTFPANTKARTPDGHANFWGSWSNYPYFESGVIIVSDITNGLFILKPTL